MSSEAVEEYLEAIFKCQDEDGHVRPSSLSRHLGLSMGAVSEMLKKMADRGLVAATGGGRYHLTATGRKEAVALVRRHRLAERFLTDLLGISWDKVHEQACRLEHVLSSEMEERLAQVLGGPETCPHGHPIPDSRGEIRPAPVRRLSELLPGERAVIERVSEEDPEMLRYMASLGLIPRVQITVEEVAPFGGPILLRVGKARYALGRQLAKEIFVKGGAT